MTCNRSRQDIQDLIDGTLGPIRRAELEQHLDQCASCRALFDDLQQLRDVAGSIEPLQPRDHVWLQIAGRLRQEGRVHDQPAPARSHHAQYAWLAIAAALVLAVGASLMLLILPGTRTESDARVAPGNAAATDAVQSGIDDLRKAEQLLQSGAAKLREGLGSDEALPPDVARTLDSGLQIYDRAIADVSAELQQDPQNVAARAGLFDLLQQKISLLQDTIALMNEVRKGNSAGVSQVVEGVNKS
jgi:hypothetical protein